MMKAVILHGSGIVAIVEVIVHNASHQSETGIGTLMGTGTETDTVIKPVSQTVKGGGSVRRVGVGRGMTMISPERGTGTGGERKNELMALSTTV